MTSMLAIVSKDVFEKTRNEAGTPLAVGEVYRTSAYVSTNRALVGQLEGDLYLVTVRGDRLWWVGTLRSPKHDGTAFRAKPVTDPIVDITDGAGKLKFATGKGIQMDKMAMSLQTPRVLLDADVALFDRWRGARAPKASRAVQSKPPTKMSRAVESKQPTKTRAAESKQPTKTRAAETEQPAKTSRAAESKQATKTSRTVESKQPAKTSRAAESKQATKTSRAAERKQPAKTPAVGERKQPARAPHAPESSQPTKTPAVGGKTVVTGTSRDDLATLRAILETRPVSLEIAMTDPHAQLPSVLALLERTGPHAVTRLRLVHQGFDAIHTERIGRDAVKKPQRLDTMLPALQGLVLEGHELFRRVGHAGVTTLDVSGLSIRDPWVEDTFPTLRSLRWACPTDAHGVAVGLGAVLPIFVDSPFPRLVQLDLSKVDVDCESSLEQLSEVTETKVWKQLESVLLPGQTRPSAPSRQNATKITPPPKLPLKLEPGHASLTLESEDFTRHRAHVLVGRTSDAHLERLTDYLKDAMPGEVEDVHVEIDPEAFVGGPTITRLMSALASLPHLRRVSTRETSIPATGLTELARSKTLTELTLLAPDFQNDASYAALEPLLGALTHLAVQRPGKPMNANRHAAFVGRARKSPSLRSLHWSEVDSSIAGAAAGDAWSQVAGEALEHLELGVDLGAAGMERLVTGLRGAAKLSHLGLGWAVRLDDAGLNHLATSKLPLASLSIIAAELDEDNKSLCSAIEKLSTLRVLTIREAGDEGGAVLASALRAHGALERLHLPDSRFSGSDALAMAKAVGGHRTIRAAALDLLGSDERQQKQIVYALAPGLRALLATRFAPQPWLVLGLLREGALSEVDLRGFSEDIERELPAIYEAAASSETLERFVATNQQHGAAAKRALVSMVEKSSSLRELDVRFCGLGDRDLVRLLEAATHSPRLEVLGIAEGEPSQAFMAALEAFASSKDRIRWL